jgi:hypothetical protein
MVIRNSGKPLFNIFRATTLQEFQIVGMIHYTHAVGILIVHLAFEYAFLPRGGVLGDLEIFVRQSYRLGFVWVQSGAAQLGKGIMQMCYQIDNLIGSAGTPAAPRASAAACLQLAMPTHLLHIRIRAGCPVRIFSGTPTLSEIISYLNPCSTLRDRAYNMEDDHRKPVS